jgi:hypothetical protein
MEEITNIMHNGYLNKEMQSITLFQRQNGFDKFPRPRPAYWANLKRSRSDGYMKTYTVGHTSPIRRHNLNIHNRINGHTSSDWRISIVAWKKQDPSSNGQL